MAIKMRRIFSFVLMFIIVCVLGSQLTATANAATVLSSTPYAQVQYTYSTTVSCGTIRYISQMSNATYFNWSYWPSGSFGGYSSPGSECGTSCISMALSYVGVNKTPNDILSANNGYTHFYDWGEATHANPTVATGMSNYINGKGKYSPVVICLSGGGSYNSYLGKYNDHFIMLVGKVSDNVYQYLDPADDTVKTTTVSGSKATYKSGSFTISKVHQWYNPKAMPSVITESYPASCTVKVTAASTTIRSLPCSKESNSNSAEVEKASKNTTFHAIGLYQNTAKELWYKVTAKNGQTGYLYAGDTSYVAQKLDDIQNSGITVPACHTAGKSYVLTGKVTSNYNQLTKISAYVRAGSSASGTVETGAEVTVNTNSFTLGGSTIDNKTKFGSLSVGAHTYVVSASYVNYYAKSATTVATNTGTVSVYQGTFYVAKSSSCSHSYTYKTTKTPTTSATGTLTATCSKCSGKITLTLPKLTETDYSYKVTKAATCAAAGTGRYTWKSTSLGKFVFDVMIAKTAHSWKNATCTAPKTCSSCGTTSGSALGHSYDDGAVTTAPGCTTEGVKTYLCTACDDQKTEPITALGHTPAEAVKENETVESYDAVVYCAACDVELSRETVVLVVSDPDVAFATTGLSLGEFIGVQSAIMKNTINGGNFDEAYFLFTQYTYNAEGVLEAICGDQVSYLDMGSYFVADCLVNAKQMSDVYEITPYYVKDGITYRGATNTTSVKAEAMKKLNDTKTDDKTKALCVAMLNYGAGAQKNFGYSLTNLANSELSDAQKVLPAFDDLNLRKTNTIPTEPFKPASSGLSLGDVVYMQFLVPMEYVGEGYELCYQIAGEKEPVTVPAFTFGTYEDRYRVIEIPIKAKNVRSSIAIGLFDAQGKRVYGYMICSVEAFATAKKGTSTETLVAALMAYGDAAKAVFG